LLALYNLMQGKEFAGQERAVGSIIYGSGHLQSEHQQKLMELIALQDRHFEIFCQFCTMPLRAAWLAMTRADNGVQHQQYRDTLTNAKQAQRLQRKHADLWFEVCSLRLTEIWHIQCALVKDIHDILESLIDQAKQDLAQTQSYLQKIQNRSSAQQELDSAFFNLSIPVENAYAFLEHESAQAYPIESILALLQQQSQQIADIESELSETKKALTERKQIERAKGLLMSTQKMTEVEAYKWMRKTAMEQNRKIIDVAENILLLYKNPA
jgi:antitoxin component HigA of HigAB toxin-antitoxin module